jgi:hypothetical protein
VFQGYYECTQWPVDAFFAALGIAASNASLLGSVSILFFLYLASKYWNNFIWSQAGRNGEVYHPQSDLDERLYKLARALIDEDREREKHRWDELQKIHARTKASAAYKSAELSSYTSATMDERGL